MPVWLRPEFKTDVGTDPGGSMYLSDANFHLKIEDKLTGYFYAMSGGDIEVTKITHDIVFETGASTTLLIPGTTSFSPITLSRGFANYYELYDWFMQASNGHIISARRNGTIEMWRTATEEDVNQGRASKKGEEIAAVVRWHFYNAWPQKLVSFGKKQTEGSIKSIARVSLTIVPETIVYERL
jgi:phage tail-like protein